MTVNKYFQNGNGPGKDTEQDLAESLIVEYIQLSGQDIFYIPRNLVKEDKLFNEAANSKFEKFWVIEMYLNNSTDFSGQGSLLEKFGLQLNNTIDLVVSKKRFKLMTTQDYPKEGDLIYWPLTGTLWQIDFVDHEPAPSYQLSKLYTWLLKCSLYTHSYEDFTTGIPAVDTNLKSETFTTPFDKNEVIEDEAVTDLDFSESNPFGDFSDGDES